MSEAIKIQEGTNEIQATLGTRHRMKTNKTKNTTQKDQKMSNTDVTKNQG